MTDEQLLNSLQGTMATIDPMSIKREEITEYPYYLQLWYYKHIFQSWYWHVTGYWEKKLPHIPGANSKQFWNIINGNK